MGCLHAGATKCLECLIGRSKAVGCGPRPNRIADDPGRHGGAVSEAVSAPEDVCYHGQLQRLLLYSIKDIVVSITLPQVCFSSPRQERGQVTCNGRTGGGADVGELEAAIRLRTGRIGTGRQLMQVYLPAW